jgi:hypothetical protein
MFLGIFPVSLLITCFTHTGFANVLLGAIFLKLHHYYPLCVKHVISRETGKIIKIHKNILQLYGPAP